jgi:hypothetical protein
LDVSGAAQLLCNVEPKRCFVGQYPFNEGFLLEPPQAAELLRKSPKLREVLFPYMIGRDLLEDAKPSRWAIDFGQRNMLEAMAYSEAFDRVKELVMPDVLAKADTERVATGKESTRWTRLALRWWQFRDYQPGAMEAIRQKPRYIACSRVTKRSIFAFIAASIHPDNTLMVFPFVDDYSFGVLQALPHGEWFVAKASSLGPTPRYTAESVFNTFPWPQSPTKRQIDAVAVAVAGREVRRVRSDALKVIDGGLRAVYRTLELPGKHPLKDAHAALDAAVLDAYGFSAKKDLLAQLLNLNRFVAAAEKAGETVTAPGVPKSYGDPRSLITQDAIQP